MNFLAHAIFADGPEDVLFGSVAGDIIDTSRVDLPDSIKAGLSLHLELDRFFDALPELERSRKLLYGQEGRPGVKHYQNAVLDICCDHVLASGWPHMFEGNLGVFVDGVYRVLDDRTGFLTQNGQEMAQRMHEQDWLRAYSTQTGLEAALTRVSERARKGQIIRDNMTEVLATVPIIEQELLTVLPTIREHMSQSMQQLGFQPEGRIRWKEGASFKESVRGRTERE